VLKHKNHEENPDFYHKPKGRYWGKIIAEPEGYQIVRYRRVVTVYCACGKRIVGQFPQRGDSYLNDYCYNCWVEVPKDSIKTILNEKGFGVSL